jgi:hypothetical protein
MQPPSQPATLDVATALAIIDEPQTLSADATGAEA